MSFLHRKHVVGSLLRPSYLLEAQQQFKSGKITQEQYRQLEDQAVEESIALQEGCGIEVVTDGELRRSVFSDSLRNAVDGIQLVHPGKGSSLVETAMDEGTYANDDEVEINKEDRGYKLEVIVEKLKTKGYPALEEYQFAQSKTSKPVKITLPSPSLVVLGYWSPQHSAHVYKNAEEAFEAWTEVLKQQVQKLVDAGCQYIQFDSPDLTFPIGSWASVYEQAGLTREEFLQLSIDTLNEVVSVPNSDVHFGLHICRGNDQGRYHTIGGYHAIAEEVFPRLKNFSQIYLEYDSVRAGGFEPISLIPDDKQVVLGLISTKTDELESAELIKSRIHEAAHYHPLENLALSPQCGFASVSAGNPIQYQTQKAKLELVNQVADEVWS